MAQVQDPDDSLQGDIDRPVRYAWLDLSFVGLARPLPVTNERSQAPIIDVRYRQIADVWVELFDVGSGKAD